MESSVNRSIALALFAVMLCLSLIGFLFFLKKVPWEEKLITQVLNGEFYSNRLNPSIENALGLLSRNTPFESRWQINQPPKKDYLNIYVLRTGLQDFDIRLPTGIQDLLGNCAFIGEPHLIVLDEEFLMNFQANHKALPAFSNDPKGTEKIRAAYRNAFLLWVLGHELGHVVRGHSPMHFAGNRLNQMVSASSIDQQKELEADQFSIQQIAPDDKRLLEVIRMLVDLINAEISSTSKKPLPAGVGLIYDYTSDVAYEYAMKEVHPEYVIRCIRMLQLENAAGRLTPVAGPGLSHLIDDLAKRMKKIGQSK
jgi:hypothetical protein